MLATTSLLGLKTENQHSVKNASTIFGRATCIIQWLCIQINESSQYRLPVIAKIVVTTLLQCSKNECQRRVNNFWPRILENPRAMRRHWPIIEPSVAILRKDGWDNIATITWKYVSAEWQQILLRLASHTAMKYLALVLNCVFNG